MSADERFPLLRGQISRTERFQSPQGGGGDPPLLPTRNRANHAAHLRGQLDALKLAAASRTPGTRDIDATREIIVVTPELGYDLPAESLGDVRTDVRVVGKDPDTGVVILDARTSDLSALRSKVADFEERDNQSGAPRHSSLLTRVKQLEVVGTAELTATPIAQSVDQVRWLALMCRGGRHDRDAARRSGEQLSRQLGRLFDIAMPTDASFDAPLHTVFYVRLSNQQLGQLIAAVDCIYEFEVAEREIGNWLSLVDQELDLSDHEQEPPAPEAPSVVILDTGIAETHPLLAPSILSVTSVLPGIDSGIDTFGHGTQMAGIALHLDGVDEAVRSGKSSPTHWIQSVRLLVKPTQTNTGTEIQSWGKRTIRAAESAELRKGPVARVFAMAVTSKLEELRPTDWSQAVEQLAWNEGAGRLICISAGNADPSVPLVEGYPTTSLMQPLEDPAQAWNALTVGACTHRTQIPPGADYADYAPVGKPGGVSPLTTARSPEADRVPNKPDIVMEGGNLAFNGVMPSTLDTLSALTTHHRTDKPLWTLNGTSEATARAANLAARIWTADPTLTPASVRGLIVHAASWTDTMLQQFPDLDERMAVCGYGEPDAELALACTKARATVIVESEMPNVVAVERPKSPPPKRPKTKKTKIAYERRAHYFQLPLSDALFEEHPDLDVELRVTLSYLPEIHAFRRRSYRGLDLKWYMQGPAEDEARFRKRINKLVRDGKESGGSPYPWDVKISRRQKGTVQSDRWRGKAIDLGPRLIAVVPILGWWDGRKDFKLSSQPYSLVVSVVAPGLDIYNTVDVALQVESEAVAEVSVKV